MPTAAPNTTAPKAGAGSTTQNLSAKAIIQAALDEYGLGSLGTWAWNRYLALGPDSANYVLDVELRDRKEFKARFPALDELAKEGRSLSIAAYLDLENRLRTLNRAYGLPEGVLDSNTDFGRLIAGDVAPAEWERRLQLRQAAAFSVPQEVRDTLQQYYGIEDTVGALTAVFADPERAITALERQFTTAQIGAAATRSGYAGIDQGRAETLAGSGVTADQAVAGFGELAGLGQVLTTTLGQEDVISTDEQIAAFFANNAQQRARIARRAQGRVAAFTPGGAYTTMQGGKTGIGSA
jgi:hypothetical protein